MVIKNNKSMIEDERLNEDEFFEKYYTVADKNPAMPPEYIARANMGHIMTKLVDEGVYKVEEVLERKWHLRNNDEKVSKFAYDLYKILDGNELMANYGDVFWQAKSKDFFSFEANFRSTDGISMVLREKFMNGEIEYDTWVNIMKEFKTYDGNRSFCGLIDDKKLKEKEREMYLKTKGALEMIPEGINKSKLILEFLVKYGYKEDERIRGYYKYDDGKSYEEGGKNSIFGRIPKELQIDDMKRIFRGIEYILDISYNEAVELFNDYLDLKIKQGEFANGVKVLLNKKSK